MAKLMEKPYPGEWEQREDETVSEYLKRVEEMEKALPWDKIITFPVCDGKACYFIKVEEPLILQHIPMGDAYRISSAHIRGLTMNDVNKYREFNKLFNKRGEKTMDKATTAMATMNKDAREAILTNRLTSKVLQAKGEVCRYDCNIGAIILGRAVDGKAYFWVEDDAGTYEVKGNRFFNVSGGEIRKPFTGKEKAAEKVAGKEKNVKGANKEKDVKKDKTVVIPKGGEMRTQLGYDGKEEKVSAVLYINKIKCACGNVRWVKNADLFQVKKCKPCMKKGRLQKINELKKSKSAKAPKTKNGYPVKA